MQASVRRRDSCSNTPVSGKGCRATSPINTTSRPQRIVIERIVKRGRAKSRSKPMNRRSRPRLWLKGTAYSRLMLGPSFADPSYRGEMLDRGIRNLMATA